MTQEQQNTLLAFQAIKQDMKLRHPVLKSPEMLTSYNGLETKVLTADGLTYNYVAGSSIPTIAGSRFAFPATGKGGGQWVLDATRCNILDFGADKTAATDSSTAINAAIAYAKTLSAINGGSFRFHIQIPNGWYLLNNTLNLTNTNGIWLVGEGGNYINSGFIGCTSNADGSGQGIMVDLTGSSCSGIRNLSLTADSGWGPKASKIGVLFALSTDGNGNQIGGLNSSVSGLFIQMYDSTSINGGLGTIGIVNVRGEEFAAKDCFVRANLPMLFSNNANLAALGVSYTVTSPFANVATTPNGSMGVVDCIGQMSLQAIQKRQPGLVLYNTNSIRFHGYISRISSTLGGEETAIRFAGQNDNVSISATVESFSRVAEFGSIANNVRLDIVTANQTAPTTNVLSVSGSTLKDCDIKVKFNNPSEFNNGRVFVYHAPVSGGELPATGMAINCNFSCSDWADNTVFVSANFLKNTANCRFNSGQPFEKVNLAIIDRKSYAVPIGNLAAGNVPIVGTILRFTKADKVNTANGNGGVYQVLIRGVVVLGNAYVSGGNCVADFEAKILVSQNQNGNLNAISTTRTVFNKSVTSPAYLDISDVTATIDLTGGVGLIKLTVSNAGSGVGEPAKFLGRVELISDFAVNQSVLFV